jgi:hypothetical protein
VRVRESWCVKPLASSIVDDFLFTARVQAYASK